MKKPFYRFQCDCLAFDVDKNFETDAIKTSAKDAAQQAYLDAVQQCHKIDPNNSIDFTIRLYYDGKNGLEDMFVLDDEDLWSDYPELDRKDFIWYLQLHY